MKIFDRLGYYLARTGIKMMSNERKANPAGYSMLRGASESPVGLEDNYHSLAHDGFKNQVIAKHAIEEVAEAVATIPMKLQAKSGDEWEDVDQHPFLDLMDAPNPTQTKTEYLEAEVGYYLLAGDVFEASTTIESGIAELWLIRPDLMRVVPSTTGIPRGYELVANGRSQMFPCDNITGISSILHIKTFNPTDAWRGLSCLRSAAHQIDQHTWAAEWNKHALQNHGSPAGAFVYGDGGDGGFPATLTSAQRQALEDQIEKSMFGPKNARRPLVLDGGIGWKTLSMTAEELAWLEGSRDAARLIALACGVPAQLLGIPGDNTYSNYEQANLAFYERTVIPISRKLNEKRCKWAMRSYKKPGEQNICYRYVPDIDQIPALAPRRQETWTMIQAATDMTINEKRKMKDMELLDDAAADEIYISATMVPLSTANQILMEPTDENDTSPVDDSSIRNNGAAKTVQKSSNGSFTRSKGSQCSFDSLEARLIDINTRILRHRK